jgi:mersacidin/lichenicidin family type 2 lantibiotic
MLFAKTVRTEKEVLAVASPRGTERVQLPECPVGLVELTPAQMDAVCGGIEWREVVSIPDRPW